MASVFPPLVANSLNELATKPGIQPAALEATVEEFNSACGDLSNFHMTELDGVATQGLKPDKTNWTRPINQPPYYGYTLRTGVTFTYLGLKVDQHAQCHIPNAPQEFDSTYPKH